MKHLTQGVFLTALLTQILLFSHCQKKEVIYEINTLTLPTTPFNYTSTSSFSNQNNPTTNDGATLGRVLFYDKNLSINNVIACASCHKQEFGFADNKAFSVGFKGGLTKRNSMPIVNLGNDTRFFWDLRTNSLEDLALQPVANHIEMGLDNTDNLIKKLKQTPYYPELFRKAFGSTDINEERISKALAQFVRSIGSRSSTYDNFLNFGGNSLNEKELAGRQLFFNQLNCSACHNGSDFNGSGSANIGLDKTYKDNGIGAFGGDNTTNGLFKVPTLRNVALTAPYMHDGRFKTLEEVVEHYNSGVQNHANLSSFMRGFLWSGNNPNGSIPSNCWNCGVGQGGTDFKPLNLTPAQKGELVAFLKTLTDESMIQDVRFSNPFKIK